MVTRFLGQIYILFVLVLLSANVFASTSGVTYQGRILKPDNSALSGTNVQFKLQLRSPDANNCLLYEELQVLDMHATNGAFSLTINDGSGTRTDSTGFNLDRIFANYGTLTPGAPNCNTGSTYSPNTGDGRNLVVYFKDETMASFEPIPAQRINFIPFAFETKQISGFTADSILKVVDVSGNPQTGISPLSNAQYAALLALANGSSTAYTAAGTLGGSALPTMTSGQVLGWNGTAWTSTSPVPAAGSITTTQLAAGAVTTSNIAGNVSINTTGTLGSAITTTRDFKIYAASPGTGFLEMKAPAIPDGTSYTLTWPLNVGTAGQVLTSDGTGVLSWAAAGTSSQWTTHGANISYDGGGNIGIGTVSPGAKLTISGDGVNNANFQQTSYGGVPYHVFSVANGTEASPTQTLSGDNLGGLTWIGYGATGGLAASAAKIQVSASENFTDSTGATNMRFFTRSTGNVASSVERMRIDADGNVGIGTAPSHSLDVRKALTGGVNRYAINAQVVSQADVTGNVSGVVTQIGTAASNYNIVNLAHFSANQGALGNVSSGGTVTNQSGFQVSANLTGATNNFGLNSAIPAAAGRWNIYASGTAQNYFAGNVGIGTTSPTALLNLKAGTATASSAPLKFTTGTVLATPEDGAMEYASSTLYYTIGSTRYVIPMNTAAGNYSNVSTIGNTTGSITMTPLSGNSVIVNATTVSTSPTTGALIVNGGAGISGALNTSGNIVSGGSITATTNGVIPQLYGSTAASGNIKIDGTSNATVGNILLATAGGNVGIGTTSPVTAFQVVGTATFGSGTTTQMQLIGGTDFSALNPGTTSTGSLIQGPVNSPLVIDLLNNDVQDSIAFRYSSANNAIVDKVGFVFKGNGYVGIGTTSPTSKLTVIDSIAGVAKIAVTNLDSGTSSLAGFAAANDAGVGALLQVGSSTNTVTLGGLPLANSLVLRSTASPAASRMVIGSPTAAPLFLVTNDTVRATFDASGNVGIGTTSPAGTLNTVGTSAIYFDRVSAPAGAGGHLMIRSTAGTAASPMAISLGTYLGSLSFTGYDGTSWPNSTFATGLQSIATDNFTSTAHGSALILNSTPNGSVNAVERMRIDQNGNIGIGTTAPTYALDIKTSGATAPTYVARIQSTTTGAFQTDTNALLSFRGINAAQNVGFAIGTGSNSWFGGHDNFGIRNTTYSTTPLMIDSTGNVGIGTTAPSSILTVNGVIESKAGGIKFPDGTTQTTAGSAAYDVSCMYSGTYNCCQISVATGAATCKSAANSSSTWVAFTNTPFSASAAGIYSISCHSDASNNIICARTNKLTGVVQLAYTASATAAWTAFSNSPF